MAAGVRLRHANARNVRYTVVDSDRPYPVPYVCSEPRLGGCGSTHTFKTYHLNLDDQGTVIVNAVLFARIKPRLIADGFTVAGEVANPPPQIIGAGIALPRVDLTLPVRSDR